MGKELKTNAMRILDRAGISYGLITYECDEFIDGIHVADQTGVPRELSYKTLLARGKSGAIYCYVLPVEKEIDLKAGARTAGEKSIEMLHVKEIQPVSGYVRGGVSPIGLKKPFPVFVEEDASIEELIYLSGGRRGTTLSLHPEDLVKVTGAKFAHFCRDEESITEN
ncbi:MAG: Cys-tRNA(Pro) deacylase [Firmicutes bacterium]|nr:Cys-tRNA(Pro) deacylase [Bacillota bacterium]